MKLTALGSGFYRVYKNGVEFSKHTSEREALESAVNLELASPADVITYKHDYEVKVESLATPTPIPPDPTPTPMPTGRIFSETSIHNTKLADNAPIHANSQSIVSEFLRQSTNTPGSWGDAAINGGAWTSPLYIITDPATPKRKVTLKYKGGAIRDEFTEFQAFLSNGIRIPVGAHADSQTDSHICLYDAIDDVYTDFWMFGEENGEYIAAFGGVILNASKSNAVFSPMKNKWGGMTEMGASATSIAFAGGLMLAKELKAGVIGHALRCSVVLADPAFVAPARRGDGNTPGNPIKEGMRLRFPKDIVIDPNWTPIAKMMVEAIRDYGCIVEDRAGSVAFYAENTNPANSIAPYMDGKQMWQIMQPQFFPFSKLVALA